MKHHLENYYAELIELTRQNINDAQTFLSQPEQTLNAKASPEAWSVLECIEHLNLYSIFYLPEIKKCLAHCPEQKSNVFKSGWLGDYFAKSMQAGPKMKKMKTFKDKNPSGSKLTISVIETFIKQQKEMLVLLDKSRAKDLNARTKITLPLLTFKLGDTFRFVIFHNQRHLVQAKKLLDWTLF